MFQIKKPDALTCLQTHSAQVKVCISITPTLDYGSVGLSALTRPTITTPPARMITRMMFSQGMRILHAKFYFFKLDTCVHLLREFSHLLLDREILECFPVDKALIDIIAGLGCLFLLKFDICNLNNFILSSCAWICFMIQYCLNHNRLLVNTSVSKPLQNFFVNKRVQLCFLLLNFVEVSKNHTHRTINQQAARILVNHRLDFPQTRHQFNNSLVAMLLQLHQVLGTWLCNPSQDSQVDLHKRIQKILWEKLIFWMDFAPTFADQWVWRLSTWQEAKNVQFTVEIGEVPRLVLPLQRIQQSVALFGILCHLESLA